MIKLLIKLKTQLFSEILYNSLINEKDISPLIDTENSEIPDVIVIDLLNLSSKLVNKYPHSKFILLDTGLKTEEILLKLTHYKLRGVFSYNSDFEKFKKAIDTVYKGQTWISNELVQALVEKETLKQINSIKITEKENEIISLVSEGLSNKEIASKLFVSEQTVKSHLNRIFKKLNIKSRSHLASVYLNNNS